MKYVFTLLLGLLSTAASFGQAYHPLIRPGVSWDVVVFDGFQICQVREGYRAFFSGTSVSVGGQAYQEMRGYPYAGASPGLLCPPFHPDLTTTARLALLREDTTTRRVYAYDGNREVLLYDFTLGAHDSLFCNPPRLIDSVATVPLHTGQLRRISYLDRFTVRPDYVLESIGSNFGPFSSMMMPGIGFEYRLEGVWENGTLVWGQPQYPLGTAGEAAGAPVTVAFDPSGRTLRCQTLPGQPAMVRLLDVAGRVVLQRELPSATEAVALPGLAPGLYFYELTTAGRRTAGRCLLTE